MVSMSVSDTEGDTPFSASLSGTGASSLNLVYSNSDSSSIGIHANGNLSAGTYTYNVKVTDSYGESTTYSDRTITVATSADYGRVFVYDVGLTGGASSGNATLEVDAGSGITLTGGVSIDTGSAHFTSGVQKTNLDGGEV